MAPTKIRYTQEQYEWLQENYESMTNKELAEAFTERFGLPLTKVQAERYGHNHSLHKARDVVAMARTCRRYGPEHIAWAREHVPGHDKREIIEAYRERFGDTLTKSQLQHLKKAAGVKQGIRAGGVKGQHAWNKGKPWDEWMSPEGQDNVSSGGMYKPGHVPHNAYHKLLDVRVNPRTGPMIYVNPRNATTHAGRWISLGRFEWMKANGRDFPEGHHLVHADHDRSNCSPENLVAVPNDVYANVTSGLHGRGIRYHDRESLETAIALVRLNKKRLEMERMAPRPCVICGKSFVPPDYQRSYAAGIKRCPACNKYGMKTGKEVTR